MNREFLEFYNRELRLLYENSSEFAEEYPGVAERLGGLTQDRMDPMIAGLLEGAAFLAARVQLKLKHEFPQFTNNLLEQIAPNFLSPTPSACLATIHPPYGEPDLKEGMTIPADGYVDATYVERERHVACKFRIVNPVELWPFEITGAKFFPNPAQLQVLGVDAGPDIVAGMQLSITTRSFARRDKEPDLEETREKPELWAAECRATHLPVHIVANEADSTRLYEKLFANCRQLYFRYLDEFGDQVVITDPRVKLEQIGFEENQTLLPADKRFFSGFDLLRESFIFPHKFLGFRLVGLEHILKKLKARDFDILFAFDQTDQNLSAIVKPQVFSLYSTCLVNLFEMQTGRVPIRSNEHEHHVVPDRSRYLEYEPHRILKVYAHFEGATDKAECFSLYSAPYDDTPSANAVFYTLRRTARRRTVEERRQGKSSNYTGTDMYLSITGGPSIDDLDPVSELSVRALCSNRHLPEHLPVGEGGADFVMNDNTELLVTCTIPPTPPRESIITQLANEPGESLALTPVWKLINMLSLNNLGISNRGTQNSPAALRELLALFADLSDNTLERRIRGIKSIDSEPVVRRLAQQNGVGAARGLQITITFDEKAFEGSGIFLMGAVLERFFAEYVTINNFTQTVIRSTDRGEIMRWPPRAGIRTTL